MIMTSEVEGILCEIDDFLGQKCRTEWNGRYNSARSGSTQVRAKAVYIFILSYYIFLISDFISYLLLMMWPIENKKCSSWNKKQNKSMLLVLSTPPIRLQGGWPQSFVSGDAEQTLRQVRWPEEWPYTEVGSCGSAVKMDEKTWEN